MHRVILYKGFFAAFLSTERTNGFSVSSSISQVITSAPFILSTTTKRATTTVINRTRRAKTVHFFPYGQPRRIQSDLILAVEKTLADRVPLVAHAPTGIGKTVAALAPAIKHAIDHDLTICFLTSRHTQHLIVQQTIRDIQRASGQRITTVSIVAKKHLCAQPGATQLPTDDFNAYCKSLRERGLCQPYSNTRNSTNVTIQARAAVDDLETQSPVTPEQLVERGLRESLCPYELATLLAGKARVIISDYFYLFHPTIRESFLTKIGKSLDKIILIIDEGHNLPDRLRDLQTHHLSTITMQRAISEAAKNGLDDVHATLTEVEHALVKTAEGMRPDAERLVTTQTFLSALEAIAPRLDIVERLEQAADIIRENQQQSAIANVAAFLTNWPDGTRGYARYVSVAGGSRGLVTTLTLRCLDPSLLAADVITGANSTIMMSGTLTPTAMFTDILGFPETTRTVEYASPFPSDNRLALVIPHTTTKFTERTTEQFSRIATICADIANATPGCSAFYFPSYAIRDAVSVQFDTLCRRTVFKEAPRMTRDDKQNILERFKQYKTSGAVLLGASTGSFGEGIDMPGVLKCVTVVGLPLDRPDLETKELINYYDTRYGKGWDYGYIFPAITKTLQNAGRCIRSEHDHGALLFLDERFAWPRYLKCFPPDWNIRVAPDFLTVLQRFFDEKNSRPDAAKL